MLNLGLIYKTEDGQDVKLLHFEEIRGDTYYYGVIYTNNRPIAAIFNNIGVDMNTNKKLITPYKDITIGDRVSF